MPIPAHHLAAYAVHHLGRAIYRRHRKKVLGLGAAALGYAGFRSFRKKKQKNKMPRRNRDQRGQRVDTFGRQYVPYAADGGSMANRKRRRTERSSNAGGNPSVMTYARMTTGRKKSLKSRAISLLRTTVVPYIDRWNALTSAYDSAGYYALSYTKVNPTDNAVMPVYTFELNQSFRTDAFSKLCPMLRLVRNDVSGNYEFVSQVCQLEENTGIVGTFRGEKQTNSIDPVSDPETSNYYHLDWTDIRMLITGPRKTATRVKVQLVRWIDDAATMPALYGNNGTIYTPHGYPTGEDLDRFNNHWQQFCAPLMNNPLSIRSAKNQAPLWTVIQSKTFEFQPRDTSEDGPTGGVGDSKVFKWFNRVGHTYDYNRAVLPANPDPDEEFNPNEWGTSNNQFDLVAKDKARLFLVISAYTPTGVDGTNLAPDVAASFDLVVRRKWLYNS